MIKNSKIQKLGYALIFCSVVNAISVHATNRNSNANDFIDYKVEEATSVYQFALMKKISVDELLFLNNSLKSNSELKSGSIIKIPKQNSNIDPTSELTTLPNLGTVPSNSNSPIIDDVLALNPTQKYINGTAEENLAHLAVATAQEEWKNFSGEELLNNIKDESISRATNKINQFANQSAENFLGRFGKAEVSIGVDVDGNLKKPELRLLAPLYDQQSNLIFSQFGIHEQGSGDDSRMIGNLGFGYRYDTESYLAGINAFLDHDFTGYNTRMGIGAEYWTDAFKLAANTYVPLSSWRESKIMKNHEALIYDERAAKGFDIRAQSYLPNYPQLGGSLKFEQYFGDEVDLFGIEERQKDPYSVELGIDYVPVPLVKTAVTHKMGKSGANETKFDFNLQLQLGTALEAQLNPDNVAISRSLKGSRYDIVDRNYDIVFEYKKEDFQLELVGPHEAMTGEIVTVNAKVASRSPIEKYEWIITKRNGSTVTRGLIPEVPANSPNFPFIMGNDDVVVRVKVTTQRGYEATSNPIIIRNILSNSGSEVVGRFSAEAIQFDDYNFEIPDLTNIFEGLSSLNKVEFDYTAKNENNEAVDISELTSIGLYWKDLNEAEFKPISTIADKVKYLIQRDPNEPSKVKVLLIADRSFVGDIGGNKSIDLAIISEKGLNINVQKTITFTYSDNKLMRLGIDPQNIMIQISEIDKNTGQEGSIVSYSGLVNGVPVEEKILENINPDSTYEVKIFVNPDPIYFRSMPINVTKYYYESLVWLYWDPMTKKEITANNNKASLIVNDSLREYRALEACRGSTKYHTQKDNYTFNELAWGEILEADNQIGDPNRQIKTEQGLRLAVQFDVTAANESTQSDTPCAPNEYEAEEGYIGYQNASVKRAVLWNEVR